MKAAFLLFDADGSNELTSKELKRACRAYGFEGNCIELFCALDTDGEGLLSLDEFMFLDSWDVDMDDLPDIPMGEIPDQNLEEFRIKSTFGGQLTAYSTHGPGPGEYDLPHVFSSTDRTPMLRHTGTFSFGKRPWCNSGSLGVASGMPSLKDPSNEPSAADYYPDHRFLAPRKPSHAFSTQSRPSNSHLQKPSEFPGPGEYLQTGRVTKGPQWSLSPRRPVKLHPLVRNQLRELPAIPKPRHMNAILPGA